MLKTTEAVVRGCSVNKVVLEVLQNLQENTCARLSFLIKLQATSATLLKKGLWCRFFPVNFAKYLRNLFHRTPLMTASELNPLGNARKILKMDRKIIQLL